ncbi:MAG: HlyC/CorC family transporter [Verrucomicrobia bacterium]|nr:HlyC/CorC family transporter [Verrucomicrobiota bacterium]
MLAAVVVLVCAGASFFFSLAETALFSLNTWQVRRLQERSGGELAAKLLAQPQDLLATMAMGNTFANAGMLAIGLWMALTTRWPMVGTVGGVLVLTLLGGEVLPKTLAVRAAEEWSLRVARPLAWLHTLARPLHQFAQRINRLLLAAVVPESVKPQTVFSDAEYRELIEFAFQQGNLAQSARDIILQIVSLDRHTVKDVMRPRAKMAAIPDDLSIEDMLTAARKHRHRRLPMFDETPDTIVGILNTRALLLDPDVDLSEVIEFPSFVPESMNLLQLFKSLQRQKRGMAIVLDEYGGVSGLVTMEDILAQLVGRLRGEVAASGFVMEKLGEGRWRVNGTMRLDDFRRQYPELGEVPGTETMGGLLMKLLDAVPAAGESATFRGLKLTAHEVDERRARALIVEKTK